MKQMFEMLEVGKFEDEDNPDYGLDTNCSVLVVDDTVSANDKKQRRGMLYWVRYEHHRLFIERENRSGQGGIIKKAST